MSDGVTANADDVGNAGTDTTEKPKVTKLPDATGDSGTGNTHKRNIAVNPDNDESKTTGINEDTGVAEVPGARATVDEGIADSGNSAIVVGTGVTDSVGRDTTEKFAVKEQSTGGKEARKQEEGPREAKDRGEQGSTEGRRQGRGRNNQNEEDQESKPEGRGERKKTKEGVTREKERNEEQSSKEVEGKGSEVELRRNREEKKEGSNRSGGGDDPKERSRDQGGKKEEEKEDKEGGSSSRGSSNSSSSPRRSRNFYVGNVYMKSLSLDSSRKGATGRKKEEDDIIAHRIMHHRGDGAQGVGGNRKTEIEELRTKAQEMRRKGNQEWRTIHAQMREIMDREKEAKNNPHLEVLKREAEGLRGKAKEAKTRGDPQWMIAHARLKEVHKQMDEWERGRRERVHRTGLQGSREKTTGNTHTVKVAGTRVTVTTVSTEAGIVQQEAPEEKSSQAQLGRSAFVGGIAPGTSSGMLQKHLQQFAQVKYCALLSGTLNDKARAAKVTFKNCEERKKAMAADDSMLDGQILRVRTWVCRPKERTKGGEFRKALAGNGPREPIRRLAPPGLEPQAQAQREEEQSDEAGEQTEEQEEGEEETALDLNAVQAGEEEAGEGKYGKTQELETNEGAKTSEGEKTSERKNNGHVSQAEQQRPPIEKR